MADADAPIEPLRNEPVALLDIAKAVVAVAAFAGIEWAEETILQIIIGINAAIVLVAATLATRRRVTPETRAVNREKQAYDDGLEVGKAQAPQVTVVQVDAPAGAAADREEPAVPRPERYADVDVFQPAVIPPAPPLGAVSMNLPIFHNATHTDTERDRVIPRQDPIPPAPTRVPPPEGLD